jgi:hypothetical protein
MDFVVDQLFDGPRFRSLTVVDNFSRKCLDIQEAASVATHGLCNLFVGRLRVAFKECSRCHNLSCLAIAAMWYIPAPRLSAKVKTIY